MILKELERLYLAKTVLFTSVLEIQTRFHIKIVFIHNSKSFWSENSQKEDYVKMMYEHDASHLKQKKIPPFIIRSLHVKKNW